MKKLTLFILVLAMAFSVCACNKTDAVETDIPAAVTQNYPEIINDVIVRLRSAYLEDPDRAFTAEGKIQTPALNIIIEKSRSIYLKDSADPAEKKVQTPDLTFMEPQKMALLSNDGLEELRDHYTAFKVYMYVAVYSALDEMYPDAPAVELVTPGYVNFDRIMLYKFLDGDKSGDATEEEMEEYLNGTVFPAVCSYTADIEVPEKDLGDVFAVTPFLDISYYDSETGTVENFSLFDEEKMTREIFDSNASEETYAYLEEYLGKEIVDAMKAEAEAGKQSALQ